MHLCHLITVHLALYRPPESLNMSFMQVWVCACVNNDTFHERATVFTRFLREEEEVLSSL